MKQLGYAGQALTQQFIRIDKAHNNYGRRLECRQSPGHKAYEIIARQILLRGICSAATTRCSTTGALGAGQRNVTLGVRTITSYVAVPAQRQNCPPMGEMQLDISHICVGC